MSSRSASLRNTAALIMLAVALPVAALAQTVTAHVAAGSVPNWMAVNPVTNKIYVANQNSANITVIDGATNRTATVPVGNTPDSVAVNPVTNKIYVANGGSNSVTVIDGVTNGTATVAAGSKPFSVAVNPVTNKIYIANVNGNNVTVIDGASDRATTVAAGTAPYSVAVNPVTDKVYVTNLNSNNLTVIDGATNSTETVATGQGPYSVAVNPVTNKIYVANAGGNSVTVIDGSSNNTATVAAGAYPISVAVNPVTNRIYVTNDLGNTVTVIDGASNAPTTLAVGSFPVSVAVNSVTNKIYVADDGGGETVIDGASNAVTAIPAAGTYPNLVALNPVTNKIYVSNYGSNDVTVIDGATNATANVTAGSGPDPAAVNPVTNKIYVPNYNDGTVTVIDGVTNETTSVGAGTHPDSVGVNPITDKIYVANAQSDNVTVIDGPTNGATTVAAGQTPLQVAVNAVTNKIYVLNANNSVTVIDGVSEGTATVAVGIAPTAIAVNPVTNKIYVTNGQSNSVTVIDGASNSTTPVSVGSDPVALAVNPLTNKIYVANRYSTNVTVIDGASNSTATVALGEAPFSVAVNPVTNQIYVAVAGEIIEARPAKYKAKAASDSSNNVTLIDGATNNTTTLASDPGPLMVNQITNKIYVSGVNGVTVIDGTTNNATIVAAGTSPGLPAVNPVTNTIYVANFDSSNVTVIEEQQVQVIPLTAKITPLVGNQTSNPTPSFTFTAVSTTMAQPNALFFQVDTWQNVWSKASGNDPTFTGALASLRPGFHILYAYAVDGREATSAQPGAPFIGQIHAYGFVVTPPLPTQTISFSAIPTQSAGRSLTLNAQASSGLPVSFSSSTTGVCTVSGATAALLVAGTCTITASQAGNSTYAPATPISRSFTVLAGAPTSSAVYTGLDVITQGTWTGQYGAEGNLIANNSTKIPAYANVSLAGATASTWIRSTSEARALQTAPGSTTRIASTYYSDTNFSINVNLKDGNWHQIALYLLDWSRVSLAETISIADAATKTVLNTQSFSGFQNGQYAVWNVKGNVIIQVTKAAGTNNAVVAGLFFDPSSALTNHHTFQVRSYGGKCLDFGAPPQVTEGPVFLYGCNGTIAQQIRVVEPDPSPAGRHQVMLFAGDKVIGIKGNTPADGAALELQDRNATAGQLFSLDGDSIIAAANRNLVVQVQSNRGANRTPLVLGKRELKDAEFWTFSAIDGSGTQPTSGFVLLPAGTTNAQLVAALNNATTFGTVIVLDGGIDLTFPDSLPLVLNAGVTLRSDRRLTDWGARLTIKNVSVAQQNLLGSIALDARHEYTRITGLRFTGPSLTEATDGIWELTGVMVDDSYPSIVDHSEFSGWTVAAVGTNNDQNFELLYPSSRSQPLHVVRNFIHHNEYTGLGYAVVASHGAFPLIEGNTFLLNRHAIAGDGSPFDSYSALYNLVLSSVPGYKRHWYSYTQREQDFDMHGTGSGGPGCGGTTEHCGGSAGQYMDIEGNTFLGTALSESTHYSFFLRGTPSVGAFFVNNVVRQSESDAIQNASAAGLLTIENNQFKAPDPTDQLAVGDFDGDRKDDLFLATGQAWYYSPAGKVEWRFLSKKPDKLNNVLFGDFDGDGRTDVVAQYGPDLMVSWGGTSDYEKLNSINASITDLAVGDFDGDGRSDIFYSDGHSWFVSSGGTGPFTLFQTSSFRVPDLRFGDLNNDGKTDVLGVVSGAWRVSYGAKSSWTLLRSKLTDSVSGLVIADFNGDGKTDIGLVQTTGPLGIQSLKVSSGGTGDWVTFSNFSGLAAVGRFQSHARTDLLLWDSNYLNILPGGKGPSVRQNPEEMR